MDLDRETGERRVQVTSADAQRRPDGLAGAAASGEAAGRRAKIIDTSMRLIARDGVATLSTRKIAREAPVHLATLHYLFGSKDDLLLAVLDAATNSMIGALVLDVHPGGGLCAALLESFATLCALLDRVPALPLVRCEVLLYVSRRPIQSASALLQHQRYLDALEACYRVAGAPGELSPIAFDELAAVVSSSIDGLALQMAAGVPRPQQEATRMHELRALLGLVPTPTGPQVRDDGATAGRPESLFEEAIRAVRNE